MILAIVEIARSQNVRRIQEGVHVCVNVGDQSQVIHEPRSEFVVFISDQHARLPYLFEQQVHLCPLLELFDGNCHPSSGAQYNEIVKGVGPLNVVSVEVCHHRKLGMQLVDVCSSLKQSRNTMLQLTFVINDDIIEWSEAASCCIVSVAGTAGGVTWCWFLPVLGSR